MRRSRIIVTVGPSTLKPDVLSKLEARDVGLIRLNMSHTQERDVAPIVELLSRYSMDICFDTEGPQVRTGYIGPNPVVLREGDTLRLFGREMPCDEQTLYIRPFEIVPMLESGDLVSLDFNSAMLRVSDTGPREHEGYVLCRVLIGGVVGSNKAVSVENKDFDLPPYSKKDLAAIEFAKANGITHFTLSFIDTAADVEVFKSLHPECTIFSKIETRRGVNHMQEILEVSDGLLLDRGDLSRQISPEHIPLIQKLLIKRCHDAGKDSLIASNILDSMTDSLTPTKGEINDIINSLLEGAGWLVLTKETAIGKYPVEVVNMMNNLCNHARQVLAAVEEGDDKDPIVARLDQMRRTACVTTSGLIVEPHGGVLVDSFLRREPDPDFLHGLKRIKVDDIYLMDAESISIGVFSPLTGFMSSAELRSVLDTMRLSNGVVWPLPVTLPVARDVAYDLRPGDEVLLCNQEGVGHAILYLDEVYEYDKDEVVQKLYGTTSDRHPGVKRVRVEGELMLSGDVKAFRRLETPYQEYDLTPRHTRRIFEQRCWSKIVGFHTRNPMHRGHEYIQRCAVEKTGADGLFVHPVVGTKKPGDFEADVIVSSYEIMADQIYPAGSFLFSVFKSYSRYCGPREALFTALCRKNYGCSHFIVGRDHTGVGDFYLPYASQAIFEKFPDLGMELITFASVYYSADENAYGFGDERTHEHGNRLPISGTGVRAYLARGERPPEWLMRSQISDMIFDRFAKGADVLVP